MESKVTEKDDQDTNEKYKKKECPFECRLYFFSIQCLLFDRKCYITELACKMLEFHSSKYLMYHLFLEAVFFDLLTWYFLCLIWAHLTLDPLFVVSSMWSISLAQLTVPPPLLLHNKLNALVKDYLLLHGLFIFFVIH